MAKENKDDDDQRPILIIKKINKGRHGAHHGGSWKVAYADFVTAMMAFFLLLWLLSVTTAVQKKKIADYFAPQVISASKDGAGGLLQGTSIADKGAKPDNTDLPDSLPSVYEDNKADAVLDKQDEKTFKKTEESIQQAMESSPDLKELAKNLLVDQTPEGLRIQIIDQDGRPMFPLGSAAPLPPAIKLLNLVTSTIKDLPNKISVRGHTDSKQYGKDASYTNWELSADRSNASRRVMLAAGLDTLRIENVQGKADREPLDMTTPDSPRNRRISIILLKQSRILQAKREEERFKEKKAGTNKPELKKHEEGVIYFP